MAQAHKGMEGWILSGQKTIMVNFANGDHHEFAMVVRFNRILSADHVSNFAAGPLDEFTIFFLPVQRCEKRLAKIVKHDPGRTVKQELEQGCPDQVLTFSSLL